MTDAPAGIQCDVFDLISVSWSSFIHLADGANLCYQLYCFFEIFGPSFFRSVSYIFVPPRCTLPIGYRLASKIWSFSIVKNFELGPSFKFLRLMESAFSFWWPRRCSERMRFHLFQLFIWVFFWYYPKVLIVIFIIDLYGRQLWLAIFFNVLVLV